MAEKAMRPQRKRIEARQSIGDPACAANDNEDFPLMAVLRRDNLSRYIELVLGYRRLVALAEAEPLKGRDYGAGKDLSVVKRSTLKDGVSEVDDAAAADWKYATVPGGEIEYRSEIKRSKAAHPLPPKRSVPTNSEIGYGVRTAGFHVKFTDATLIEHIDAKPVLAALRAALGPLLDPFEDAVLGGRTFSQIGRGEKFDVKPDVAGKALVFRALAAVDGAWDEIRRRQARFDAMAKAA
ncbi:hypothetical protein [Rhizobium mayense]|uniref:hypothetical protein n=1 Tax=Rhizobium mayense TaxID=1312184 RepID=UPI00398C470E